MADLETLLREGQDRLRGRPQNWWERNGWRVQRAAQTAATGLLFVLHAAWTASIAFIAWHFIVKFW